MMFNLFSAFSNDYRQEHWIEKCINAKKWFQNLRLRPKTRREDLRKRSIHGSM